MRRAACSFVDNQSRWYCTANLGDAAAAAADLRNIGASGWGMVDGWNWRQHKDEARTRARARACSLGSVRRSNRPSTLDEAPHSLHADLDVVDRPTFGGTLCSRRSGGSAGGEIMMLHTVATDTVVCARGAVGVSDHWVCILLPTRRSGTVAAIGGIIGSGIPVVVGLVHGW